MSMPEGEDAYRFILICDDWLLVSPRINGQLTTNYSCRHRLWVHENSFTILSSLILTSSFGSSVTFCSVWMLQKRGPPLSPWHVSPSWSSPPAQTWSNSKFSRDEQFLSHPGALFKLLPNWPSKDLHRALVTLAMWRSEEKKMKRWDDLGSVRSAQQY